MFALLILPTAHITIYFNLRVQTVRNKMLADKMANSENEPSKKYYKVISKEELKRKMVDCTNDNTENAEKRADKALKLFLTDSGAESTEYYFLEEPYQMLS